MNNQATPDLLPCPFCGGIPTLKFSVAVWMLRHKCTVLRQTIEYGEERDRAIARWNTRAEVQP